MAYTRKALTLASILSFVLAFAFLMTSISVLTGLAVLEHVAEETGSVLTIVFIIVGLLFWFAKANVVE